VVRPPVSVSPLDGSKNRLSRLQTGSSVGEGVSRSSVRALRIEPSDSKCSFSACAQGTPRQKNPQARASRSRWRERSYQSEKVVVITQMDNVDD